MIDPPARTCSAASTAPTRIRTARRPGLSGGQGADFYLAKTADFSLAIDTWLLLPPFLLYSIATTIPEEVGWRGFALPRLQSRYGSLWASLVVGVLWGFWHLPLFFSPDAAQSGISFPLFLAVTIFSSFLFTWVFNRTEGSLLMVVLLHSSFNASNVFLPLLPQVTGSDLQLLLFVGVIAVAATTVAAVELSKSPVERAHRLSEEA